MMQQMRALLIGSVCLLVGCGGAAVGKLPGSASAPSKLEKELKTTTMPEVRFEAEEGAGKP